MDGQGGAITLKTKGGKQREASMTEAEWWACGNLVALEPLLTQYGSRRKHWLFATACCRAVIHLLSERSRESLEAVEGYVHGSVSEDELREIFRDFLPHQMTVGIVGGLQAAEAIRSLGYLWWRHQPLTPSQVEFAITYSVYRAARSAAEAMAKTIPWPAARRSQCGLLRDVLRCPIGDRTPFDPEWVTPTVASLALAAYDERDLPSGHLDLTRLAILSDALQDAGCADSNILDHLRDPGPHVRGCWGVDLILNRE